MGSLFGTDTPQVDQEDYSDINPLQNMYYDQINGRSPLAQAQFEDMANQSVANTKRSIASMTGVRGSQKASLLNNALANQQSQLAGTAAIMAAQERQQAMGNLGQLLMGKHGQQLGVNQFNAQQQTDADDRFAKLVGAGLTAGGMMYGGKK